MTKIKPNQPCPCGSGKKYKKCCCDQRTPHFLPIELPEGFDFRKLQAAHVDDTGKKVIFFTKDMLLNQLTRDTPPIEASFDAIAEVDLKASSIVFSKANGIIFPQVIKRRNDTTESQATCARLLMYALDSYIAAIHLARGGFRRQYGAMIRNVIETLAVVLLIHSKPDEALPEFNQDKLSSTKAISFAKKILPFFGRFYGHLSDTFVHIGNMQNEISPLNKYDKEEEALKYILPSIRIHAWFIYIVAELVFYPFIAKPEYWRKLADLPEGIQFSYDPSAETKELLHEYLGAATDMVA